MRALTSQSRWEPIRANRENLMPFLADDLTKWMQKLNDNKKLSEICMPGSHDAGLYQVSEKRPAVKDSDVITQNGDILEQLNAGVRFFDLRFYEKDPGDIRIGHFFEMGGNLRGHADMGAYGPSIGTVLADVHAFMQNAPKETVILRLSHIKNSLAEQVVDAVHNSPIQDMLYTGGLAIGSGMSGVRLGQTRGKVITVYETASFASLRAAPRGVYTFSKKSSHRPDLLMCGEFSGKYEYDDMVTKQLTNLTDHPKHMLTLDPHLSQLYWTLTGGNIRQNTQSNLSSDNARKSLERMIIRYTPNIVLYDFCNRTLSKLIIEAGND